MRGSGTKGALSPGRKRLVEMMQRLNFGRIENLVIRGGEPVFHPPPRVVREVKFCAENGPNAKAGLTEFSLKSQVRDLFAHLDRLDTGTVWALQVKHGLPFLMIVEDAA